MAYSEYPIEKKIQTLMRDLSFYYISEWFDTIPEEDSDGDIQKSHQLLNEKFAKKQIDSFFFTANFQPILYPAYALLMYYKYNSKFAGYVNSIYMNDEKLIDDLHNFFHGELEKRINEAMEEEQIAKPFALDKSANTILKTKSSIHQRNSSVPFIGKFATPNKITLAAAGNDDTKIKLAPPLNTDKDITVVRAEIWKEKLRIDFSDRNDTVDYFIRTFDKNLVLVKEFSAKAEPCIDNTELKVLFIDNCSPELFIGNYWDITKE